MTDFSPLYQEWKSLTKRLQMSPALQVNELCEDAFAIAPKVSNKTTAESAKSYACTIMAITHGDEIGGLAALNIFLQELDAATITGPIAIVLGNISAAQAGKRYLEKDLNRSFSALGVKPEIERARKIADHVLSKTAFLLDIHQTIEPSREPFFIFPFQKEAYLWARTLDPKMALVTHWGAPFSQDGMCTDAFVSSQGGVGVTVELGQAGLEKKQLKKGVELIRSSVKLALATYHNQTNILETKSIEETLNADQKIFTWAHTEPYPTAPVQLRDGLFNFLEVKHGESIGKVGGRELHCGADGWMMFPKYNRQNQQPPPAELYRILKQLSSAERKKIAS